MLSPHLAPHARLRNGAHVDTEQHLPKAAVSLLRCYSPLLAWLDTSVVWFRGKQIGSGSADAQIKRLLLS